jgi:hypothetical protein
LGAASDLVNTLEPSFFAVLVFSKKLNLTAIHMAPTVGPVASEILRSIRQCSADGTDASGQTKQLGIAKWTERIAKNPRALNEYLLGHIGPNLRDYSAKKQKFLKETGFDGAYLSLNAKLFGTPEEVADAFLGDRSILGELVSAFEERFKIPLPLENFAPSAGSFEFSPEPYAQVKAKFGDPLNGQKFRFDGQEYRLPSIIAASFSKVKLEFSYFTLYLVETPGGLGKIALSVKSKDLKEVRDTARRWLEFYRFLDSASKRKLEVQVRRIGSSGTALFGTAGGDSVISERFQTSRAVAILNLLDTVVRDCGLESAELSPDDVNSLEHMLDCLVRSSGKAGPPYLHLEIDRIDNPLTKRRALMLFTFRFLDQFLTIYVQANMVEYVPGKSRDIFKLERVKYLKSDITDDYEEVEAMASALASKHPSKDVLMLPQGDVGR